MPDHRAKPNQGRDVAVSKALSYLLRHAAEKEGLEMNAQGYANVQDVLSWRKLKSLKVTFPEILNAVAESEKKRFALLHVPSVNQESATTTTTTTITQPSSLSTAEPTSTPTNKEGAGVGAVPEEPSTVITPTTTAGQETATQKALTVTDGEPSHFLIRATQGHSIKTIDAASLLEKLSLADEASLPSTVVHGTFHSAWPAILESGGLRCMGRNHVHFATGPALECVLPDGKGGDGGVRSLLQNDGKVISGMRRDAQVLIYIDLKKAMQAGCPFWRSENGVILSEGVATEERGNLVPLEVFDVVVERACGLGKLWEGGSVLKELPGELTRKGGPKGKRNR